MDAVIAQLVEQPPCKRQVVGSSPTCGSIFVAPDNHNELGTGASQGANGSSPTCGSTSKNNRECKRSLFLSGVKYLWYNMFYGYSSYGNGGTDSVVAGRGDI